MGEGPNLDSKSQGDYPVSAMIMARVRRWFKEALDSPRDKKDGEPQIKMGRKLGGNKQLVRINRTHHLDGSYSGYVEVEVDNTGTHVTFIGKGR